MNSRPEELENGRRDIDLIVQAALYAVAGHAIHLLSRADS